MAQIPKNDYGSRVDSTDVEYPQGKAINLIGAVVGTGTPVEAQWINDDWGFKQEILVRSGIVPSGFPDKVGDSQYLDGIVKINNTSLNTEDTNTSYTILQSDLGKTILLDNAASITLNVPTGLSEGFTCDIVQKGVGVVTVTEVSTTVNSRGGLVDTNGQWSVLSLKGIGTNTYILSGDLA